MYVGNVLRKKWKNIRDQYVKKKRELKSKSGQAQDNVKKGAFFNHLAFLDDHIESAR